MRTDHCLVRSQFNRSVDKFFFLVSTAAHMPPTHFKCSCWWVWRMLYLRHFYSSGSPHSSTRLCTRCNASQAFAPLVVSTIPRSAFFLRGPPTGPCVLAVSGRGRATIWTGFFFGILCAPGAVSTLPPRYTSIVVWRNACPNNKGL